MANKNMNSKDKKYKLYVFNKGWVSDYDNRGILTGKRYRFNCGYKNEAIELTFLEALNCINDCNDNRYNNWNFKISNEKSFISEFKKFKKEKREEFDAFYRYVDINNPLIHHKKIITVEWACIQRVSFCKANMFAQPMSITWYYCLTTDKSHYTSGILGFKKVDGIYEFETFNSIYKVKKMLDIPYTDQIKEIEAYFKSNSFNEFMEMEKEHQIEEMNR